MSNQTSQQLDLVLRERDGGDPSNGGALHPLLRVSAVYRVIKDLQPALLTAGSDKKHVFDMIHHYLLGRKKCCLETLLQDELNEALLEAVIELRAFKREHHIRRLKDLDAVFRHLLNDTLKQVGLPPV